MKKRDTDTHLRELRSLFFQIRCLMRERLPDSRDSNTWLRVETMRFIAERPGCTAGEVAHFVRVSAPSASALMAALSRAQHVRRESAPDRRSARLFLTARGKRELARAERLSLRAMRGVFGALSLQDIAKLRAILRTIIR